SRDCQRLPRRPRQRVQPPHQTLLLLTGKGGVEACDEFFIVQEREIARAGDEVIANERPPAIDVVDRANCVAELLLQADGNAVEHHCTVSPAEVACNFLMRTWPKGHISSSTQRSHRGLIARQVFRPCSMNRMCIAYRSFGGIIGLRISWARSAVAFAG